MWARVLKSILVVMNTVFLNESNVGQLAELTSCTAALALLLGTGDTRWHVASVVVARTWMLSLATWLSLSSLVAALIGDRADWTGAYVAVGGTAVALVVALGVAVWWVRTHGAKIDNVVDQLKVYSSSLRGGAWWCWRVGSADPRTYWQNILPNGCGLTAVVRSPMILPLTLAAL
jgi:hypothetical protein